MKDRSQLAAACATLSLRPLTGVWYRVMQPQFWPTALATAHTKVIPSRFSEGGRASPQFELLYLAENPMVALFEVQALFGALTTPGEVMAQPKPWTILNVDMQLHYVADLTQVIASSLNPLDTTAQEITGDWRGYAQRNPNTSVSQPPGSAPTHDLGAVLSVTPTLEGFITVSARLPYHQNLVVFPEKLQSGSSVQFNYPGGVLTPYRLPHSSTP